MFKKEAFHAFMNRHFFKPADGRSLNLFRLLFCSFILWRILADAPPLFEQYNSVAWNPVPAFEFLGIGQLSLFEFEAWMWVLVGALACTALGAFTRVSASVACLAYFIYIGNFFGFTKSEGVNYVSHDKSIVLFVLLVLAVAPGVNLWGIDGWFKRGFKWRPATNRVISAWPTQLIKLLIGVAYFGAGFAKISSSLGWADGVTLQTYLVQKYLLIDVENALWLSQYFWICLLLGVGTLALELTFFMVVFRPRLTWCYVIAGLSFHLGILWAMEINFLAYFGVTYFIFLEWRMLAGLLSPVSSLKKWAAQSSTTLAPTAPVGNTRFALLFVLILWWSGNVCVFARVEAWPFTDYGVFRKRTNLEFATTVRMAGVNAEGQRTFLTRDEYPMGEGNGWKIAYSRLRRYQGRPDQQNETVQAVADHLRKTKPNKYESLEVVHRQIEGTPGHDDFRIIERVMITTRLADEGRTEVVHIAAEDQPTQMR